VFLHLSVCLIFPWEYHRCLAQTCISTWWDTPTKSVCYLFAYQLRSQASPHTSYRDTV